ncbi:MAG: hypothetical protein ACK4GQ_04380 [Candidatus Hadarchaeales archaeon]
MFVLAQTLVEVILMVLVIVLLAIQLFGSGSIIKKRQLQKEVETLRAKIKEMEEARSAQSRRVETRPPPDLFDFVRDLEILRSAIAGSRICQRALQKKYRLSPSAELLKKIMSSYTIEQATKERLADEFLVGEVGRGIMKSLKAGATIERAAAEVGVPILVAKGQIARLQILGYLDNKLKVTPLGERALK